MFSPREANPGTFLLTSRKRLNYFYQRFYSDILGDILSNFFDVIQDDWNATIDATPKWVLNSKYVSFLLCNHSLKLGLRERAFKEKQQCQKFAECQG
jgi:hypothetical protein